MAGTAATIEHIGRFLLASLFILAGINKFANPADAAAMMAGAAFPFPSLPVYAVAAFELGGGLVLLAGRRGAA
jgi:putative oxidoreductase